jgi:predicted restriction endonuclease
MDYKKYNSNWKEISNRVRAAYGNRCAKCGAKHMSYKEKTDSTIIITIHHIDGNCKNDHDYNLVPLCQKHHLDLHRGVKNIIDHRQTEMSFTAAYKPIGRLHG